MAIRRIYLLLCGGLLLIFLTGCAGLKKWEMLQKAGDLPPRFELNTVPFFPQKVYQCGPAALAMALNWSGLPVSPEDLTDEVFTPTRKGSLQTALISSARRHGRIAYISMGMDAIFSEVAAGHPVVILQNLGLSWYPVWHYSVVIGYDLPKKFVILRSGTTPRKIMHSRVFQNTWARSNYWGLLILRPEQLPSMAKEDLFLEAVLGLEKARQFPAAIHGYKTALTRWPQSLAALMGIGNCHYALGKLKDAESAFRETVHLHPKEGAAFNNLAQILWDQGQKQEALEAARKAVSLGGPLSAVYQKTLEEIQSGAQ
ncbi:MAG: PA2778 family cysteine peptidase [Deltaproteobacteria bacterium]|nr:PA2778 family cysteine peptidase [Deltaproteobacteria bacterium]MBW2619767.1 PA2778 family cysteine peptidase [Deltaproteobacteria bacterium]